MSDRNTGSDNFRNVQSIWTKTPGEWRGTAQYNDNHARTENTVLLNTQYADGPQLEGDNIFEAGGEFDAKIIYSGK